MVICRLHYEEQCLLLLVVIVVKVPKLLLRFPPFDNATEASDGKEYLHIPVAAMPVGVVIPCFANHLHSLYNGLDALGLRCELGNSHIDDVGCNRYELVEVVHDGVNGIVDEDARRTAIT
jgi:hypothetical protein